MKRTFNYTGRARIEKQQIELDIHTIGGDVTAAGRVRFDDPAAYPPDSMVLLYVRRGPIRRELELGPVRTEVRFHEKLEGFTDAEGITVDVRVYDNADPARRLLGLARGVRGGPDDGAERESLLTTRRGDFDVPVWRVGMDFDQGPYLEISRKCADYRQLARRDEFLALVMPAVIRQIATHLLVEERYEGDPGDDEDREARWVRFMTDLPGVGAFKSDMSVDERVDLVEQIETAFAREAEVLRRGAALLNLADEDME